MWFSDSSGSHSVSLLYFCNHMFSLCDGGQERQGAHGCLFLTTEAHWTHLCSLPRLKWLILIESEMRRKVCVRVIFTPLSGVCLKCVIWHYVEIENRLKDSRIEGFDGLVCLAHFKHTDIQFSCFSIIISLAVVSK